MATSSARSQKHSRPSLSRAFFYPDDCTTEGQGLRFVQEYFLVACSLADLIRRFRRSKADWSTLPQKVAVQLNDTHPAIAVPELMRILLDEAHLGWDEAWALARGTLAYTNHTLLPEAFYADARAWARTAILNVASSGKFSSDRTIAEYAADIWHTGPCPVS
jgi:starch phosphorylase